MRFARGDMRDHIVPHKNDHGASYGRYGVLRWRSQLKISFCEIFGVARFSTFATQSAKSGSPISASDADLLRSAGQLPHGTFRALSLLPGSYLSPACITFTARNSYRPVASS